LTLNNNVLAAGNNTIRADYPGNSAFKSSTGSVSEQR
jgi:hypothetical protein